MRPQKEGEAPLENENSEKCSSINPPNCEFISTFIKSNHLHKEIKAETFKAFAELFEEFCCLVLECEDGRRTLEIKVMMNMLDVIEDNFGMIGKNTKCRFIYFKILENFITKVITNQTSENYNVATEFWSQFLLPNKTTPNNFFARLQGDIKNAKFIKNFNQKPQPQKGLEECEYNINEHFEKIENLCLFSSKRELISLQNFHLSFMACQGTKYKSHLLTVLIREFYHDENDESSKKKIENLLELYLLVGEKEEDKRTNLIELIQRVKVQSNFLCLHFWNCFLLNVKIEKYFSPQEICEFCLGIFSTLIKLRSSLPITLQIISSICLLGNHFSDNNIKITEKIDDYLVTLGVDALKYLFLGQKLLVLGKNHTALQRQSETKNSAIMDECGELPLCIMLEDFPIMEERENDLDKLYGEKIVELSNGEKEALSKSIKKFMHYILKSKAIVKCLIISSKSPSNISALSELLKSTTVECFQPVEPLLFETFPEILSEINELRYISTGETTGLIWMIKMRMFEEQVVNCELEGKELFDYYYHDIFNVFMMKHRKADFTLLAVLHQYINKTIILQFICSQFLNIHELYSTIQQSQSETNKLECKLARKYKSLIMLISHVLCLDGQIEHNFNIEKVKHNLSQLKEPAKFTHFIDSSEINLHKLFPRPSIAKQKYILPTESFDPPEQIEALSEFMNKFIEILERSPWILLWLGENDDKEKNTYFFIVAEIFDYCEKKCKSFNGKCLIRDCVLKMREINFLTLNLTMNAYLMNIIEEMFAFKDEDLKSGSFLSDLNFSFSKSYSDKRCFILSLYFLCKFQYFEGYITETEEQEFLQEDSDSKCNHHPSLFEEQNEGRSAGLDSDKTNGKSSSSLQFNYESFINHQKESGREIREDFTMKMSYFLFCLLLKISVAPSYKTCEYILDLYIQKRAKESLINNTENFEALLLSKEIELDNLVGESKMINFCFNVMEEQEIGRVILIRKILKQLSKVWLDEKVKRYEPYSMFYIFEAERPFCYELYIEFCAICLFVSSKQTHIPEKLTLIVNHLIENLEPFLNVLNAQFNPHLTCEFNIQAANQCIFGKEFGGDFLIGLLLGEITPGFEWPVVVELLGKIINYDGEYIFSLANLLSLKIESNSSILHQIEIYVYQTLPTFISPESTSLSPVTVLEQLQSLGKKNELISILIKRVCDKENIEQSEEMIATMNCLVSSCLCKIISMDTFECPYKSLFILIAIYYVFIIGLREWVINNEPFGTNVQKYAIIVSEKYKGVPVKDLFRASFFQSEGRENDCIIERVVNGLLSGLLQCGGFWDNEQGCRCEIEVIEDFHNFSPHLYNNYFMEGSWCLARQAREFFRCLECHIPLEICANCLEKCHKGHQFIYLPSSVTVFRECQCMGNGENTMIECGGKDFAKRREKRMEELKLIEKERREREKLFQTDVGKLKAKLAEAEKKLIWKSEKLNKVSGPNIYHMKFIDQDMLIDLKKQPEMAQKIETTQDDLVHEEQRSIESVRKEQEPIEGDVEENFELCLEELTKQESFIIKKYMNVFETLTNKIYSPQLLFCVLSNTKQMLEPTTTNGLESSNTPIFSMNFQMPLETTNTMVPFSQIGKFSNICIKTKLLRKEELQSLCPAICRAPFACDNTHVYVLNGNAFNIFKLEDIYLGFLGNKGIINVPMVVPLPFEGHSVGISHSKNVIYVCSLKMLIGIPLKESEAELETLPTTFKYKPKEAEFINKLLVTKTGVFISLSREIHFLSFALNLTCVFKLSSCLLKEWTLYENDYPDTYTIFATTSDGFVYYAEGNGKTLGEVIFSNVVNDRRGKRSVGANVVIKKLKNYGPILFCSFKDKTIGNTIGLWEKNSGSILNISYLRINGAENNILNKNYVIGLTDFVEHGTSAKNESSESKSSVSCLYLVSIIKEELNDPFSVHRGMLSIIKIEPYNLTNKTKIQIINEESRCEYFSIIQLNDNNGWFILSLHENGSLVVTFPEHIEKHIMEKEVQLIGIEKKKKKKGNKPKEIEDSQALMKKMKVEFNKKRKIEISKSLQSTIEQNKVALLETSKKNSSMNTEHYFHRSESLKFGEEYVFLITKEKVLEMDEEEKSKTIEVTYKIDVKTVDKIVTGLAFRDVCNVILPTRIVNNTLEVALTFEESLLIYCKKENFLVKTVTYLPQSPVRENSNNAILMFFGKELDLTPPIKEEKLIFDTVKPGNQMASICLYGKEYNYEAKIRAMKFNASLPTLLFDEPLFYSTKDDQIRLSLQNCNLLLSKFLQAPQKFDFEFDLKNFIQTLIHNAVKEVSIEIISLYKSVIEKSAMLENYINSPNEEPHVFNSFLHPYRTATYFRIQELDQNFNQSEVSTIKFIILMREFHGLIVRDEVDYLGRPRGSGEEMLFAYFIAKFPSLLAKAAKKCKIPDIKSIIGKVIAIYLLGYVILKYLKYNVDWIFPFIIKLVGKKRLGEIWVGIESPSFHNRCILYKCLGKFSKFVPEAWVQNVKPVDGEEIEKANENEVEEMSEEEGDNEEGGSLSEIDDEVRLALKESRKSKRLEEKRNSQSQNMQQEMKPEEEQVMENDSFENTLLKDLIRECLKNIDPNNLSYEQNSDKIVVMYTIIRLIVEELKKGNMKYSIIMEYLCEHVELTMKKLSEGLRVRDGILEMERRVLFGWTSLFRVIFTKVMNEGSELSKRSYEKTQNHILSFLDSYRDRIEQITKIKSVPFTYPFFLYSKPQPKLIHPIYSFISILQMPMMPTYTLLALECDWLFEEPLIFYKKIQYENTIREYVNAGKIKKIHEHAVKDLEMWKEIGDVEWLENWVLERKDDWATGLELIQMYYE